MSKAKVPVTARALEQRINRRLEDKGECLKKARSTTASTTLGDYFVVDINGNYVVEKDVDLEAKARELGVLQPYESVKQ